jgi:predicted ferric reductase
MDKIDKFNSIILDMSTNWKYIFYFVAGIYILSTIMYIAIANNSRWGLAIISWAILVLVAIAMTIATREKKDKTPYRED